MLKKYFLNNKKRNFSTTLIWIKGGSDMDSIGKKGINNILCSLLTRGCEGFNNFTLSEYIESYGAELNQEIFEDGISISIKCLNEHFNKLFPLLELIINKPILSETEFKKVKKSSIDHIKKDKENPFNICFEKWRKIVYLNHPYAFNTIGNANDVSKITYEDVLLEFKNFKNREKYLISNNPKINGENFGTLEKKILKEQSGRVNHYLTAANRFDYINNDSNQTIIMMGDQTCSRRSSEYFPLKVLESYLSYGMSGALFKLFREKKVKIDKVLSSQWCRCKDTAKYAFGNFKEFSALNSTYTPPYDQNEKQQIEDLKKYANNWNGEGGNLVLVTHYVIILAITGETTRSGEIVITDKNFKVLSKINTF